MQAQEALDYRESWEYRQHQKPGNKQESFAMEPIERREFLKSVMIAGAAVQAGEGRGVAHAQSAPEGRRQMARCQPRGLAGAGEMDHARRLCRAEGRRRILAL